MLRLNPFVAERNVTKPQDVKITATPFCGGFEIAANEGDTTKPGAHDISEVGGYRR